MVVVKVKVFNFLVDVFGVFWYLFVDIEIDFYVVGVKGVLGWMFVMLGIKNIVLF